MKTIGYLAVAMICICRLTQAASFFHCEITEGGLYAYEPDRTISFERNTKSLEFTLTKAGTEWGLVGNLGQSELVAVREDDELVVLIEAPPVGGINVYTIYLDKNVISYSKQYSFGSPLLVVGMGTFKLAEH